MRYTQTKLDKIIMIGLGKMDNAVEAAIESYYPKPKQIKTAKKMSGLKLNHKGCGIYVEAGCTGVKIENCTITTEPHATAITLDASSESKIRQDASARGVSGLHNLAAAQGSLQYQQYFGVNRPLGLADLGFAIGFNENP